MALVSGNHLLLYKLRDFPWEVEEMANKEELGQMKQQEVAKFIDVLKSEDVYRAFTATSVLGTLGESAVEPLVSMLSDEEPGMRWRAAIALGKVGSPAVDALIAALASETSRIPAAWALAEIGDARATPPLVQILESDSSECCREIAAASLLKLNDPVGVQKVEEVCAKEGDKFKGVVLEAFFGT
jgi:HEAT repeat protein